MPTCWALIKNRPGLFRPSNNLNLFLPRPTPREGRARRIWKPLSGQAREGSSVLPAGFGHEGMAKVVCGGAGRGRRELGTVEALVRPRTAGHSEELGFHPCWQ